MKFSIALCQMAVSEEKKENCRRAEKWVQRAAEAGADIVTLPEMWNCPYSNDYFRPYAEPEDGDTVAFLSRMAQKYHLILVGGSIPELDQGNVYNTSFIFDASGTRIGKHRKAHLFDIDIKGGIRFMESDTLRPGDHATVVDTALGKIGVAICYDVRFPELSRRMALMGAELIVLPAAFNMTTGPAHWELSMRARALDNQVYFAACSPARQENSVYEAWGHSMVTDPWGQVVAETGIGEDLVLAEIDTGYEAQIRQQLPLLRHRREELYGYHENNQKK